MSSYVKTYGSVEDATDGVLNVAGVQQPICAINNSGLFSSAQRPTLDSTATLNAIKVAFKALPVDVRTFILQGRLADEAAKRISDIKVYSPTETEYIGFGIASIGYPYVPPRLPELDIEDLQRWHDEALTDEILLGKK